MKFDVINTLIDGLKIVQRKPIEDERGFLSRLYCNDDFKMMGINKPICQINQTYTKSSGTVRGMHFQTSPFAETKLVSCIKGEVFDVAVDLRKGSSTYLKWHAEILTEKNQRCLLIPEGFAHGFQTITDNCELIYLHTAPFSKDHEGAVNALDENLAIAWPLKITQLSDRDRLHPMIKDDFKGIVL